MQRTKVPKSVRPVSRRWMPELWASPKPFGLGEPHANNFWEVFRAVWENRDQLSYAYQILNDGVCDGCLLGTSGMTDWTKNSLHVCNIRLRLLRLNTMQALDSNILGDVKGLQSMRSRDLRALGRLPHPLIRAGEVLVADVAAGTIEVHWPEGNVLVNPRARSPLAKIPAYKEFWAAVEPVEKAASSKPILNP